MRIKVLSTVFAVPLSLCVCGAVLAQEDPTTAPTPPPARLCIDSPIRDLLANPAAVAVLDKDMPGMTSDPRLDMVKSMSMRQIARFPEAHLDDAKLARIEADLEGATAGAVIASRGSTSPASSPTAPTATPGEAGAATGPGPTPSVTSPSVTSH